MSKIDRETDTKFGWEIDTKFGREIDAKFGRENVAILLITLPDTVVNKYLL